MACPLVFVLHGSRLVSIVPGRVREWSGALGRFGRFGVRGGTLTDAACNTLRDARKTEEILREVPVQIRNVSADELRRYRELH